MVHLSEFEFRALQILLQLMNVMLKLKFFLLQALIVEEELIFFALVIIDDVFHSLGVEFFQSL